jgi:hypothetical protein
MMRHFNDEINLICNTNSVNTLTSNTNKEITMNAKLITHTLIARIVRNTAALAAFCCLMALSTVAHSQVLINSIVGPQQTIGVTPGVTAMQVRVQNFNGYAVSGFNVQTFIYLNTDVNNGWTVRAMPASPALSLAAYESRWITIPIPTYSLQGSILRDKRLTAKAVMLGRETWLNNFLNSPAQQQFTTQILNVYNNANGSRTFTLRITNNGFATTAGQQVTVSTSLYADGSVGAALTQTRSLPVLQTGQSTNMSFTTQPTQGYQIKGIISLPWQTVNFSL